MRTMSNFALTFYFGKGLSAHWSIWQTSWPPRSTDTKAFASHLPMAASEIGFYVSSVDLNELRFSDLHSKHFLHQAISLALAHDLFILDPQFTSLCPDVSKFHLSWWYKPKFSTVATYLRCPIYGSVKFNSIMSGLHPWCHHS